MRAPRTLAAPLLWLGACSASTGPGTPALELSQAQAAAIAEVLVKGGVGPILPLAPQQVTDGVVQVPIVAATLCPASGTTTLSGTIQGSAAGGSAALVVNASESASRCVVVVAGQPIEVNGVPALVAGGLLIYADGVLASTQTMGLAGTIQVIGDGGVQALCPVDLSVTITNWSPTVLVSGAVCGRGVDQTVVL